MFYVYIMIIFIYLSPLHLTEHFFLYTSLCTEQYKIIRWPTNRYNTEKVLLTNSRGIRYLHVVYNNDSSMYIKNKQISECYHKNYSSYISVKFMYIIYNKFYFMISNYGSSAKSWDGLYIMTVFSERRNANLL